MGRGLLQVEVSAFLFAGYEGRPGVQFDFEARHGSRENLWFDPAHSPLAVAERTRWAW